MASLAPPLNLATTAPGERRELGLVPAVHTRPFGLSRAIPSPDRRAMVPDDLTVCPERQITLTADGSPFIHTPNMKTAVNTTSETVEDGQKWDDDEGTDAD